MMKKKTQKADWRETYSSQEKYDAENAVRKTFKFNKNTDADILEALSKADNKLGFVKEAIRFYLAHREDFND